MTGLSTEPIPSPTDTGTSRDTTVSVGTTSRGRFKHIVLHKALFSSPVKKKLPLRLTITPKTISGTGCVSHFLVIDIP